MVGRYKRKSTRMQWAEEQMAAAINAVQSREMGWLLASKTFGVPFGTLRRRCQGTNKISTGTKKDYMGGKRPTFNANMERQIVDHIRDMEERFYGMTTTDVRKLAFDLAVKNNIPHQFNIEKGLAGKDWLTGFRNRNPNISLRLPESTSAARARAFNKPQMEKYFNVLEKALDTINYDPTRIYNMDESGFSTVPSKNERIFAKKGRKQVGILTSTERGKHFTVVCAMSSGGTYIPPCFIFPRKNMKNELMDNCPAGSIAFTQEHGWINADIFMKWLQFFVKTVRPSPEEKVLLLLDGHSSHKSLEAQTYAKENGVIIFCFPPHCTHRVQPLDVSFFGPLTTYYNQELLKWLKLHPGRVVTHFQVGGIFKEAYLKAATIKNAENGYSKTGIFPFNKDIFPDHLFQPAYVTDTDIEDTENVNERGVVEKDDIGEAPENVTVHEDGDTRVVTSGEKTNSRGSEKKKVTSGEDFEALEEDEENNMNNSNLQKFIVTPSDVSPLPKAESSGRKRKRNSGKFGILNSTPEIEKLKLTKMEELEKVLRKAARKAKTKLKLADEDEEDEEGKAVISSDDDEDAACIYCNELFSQSKAGDGWIRCLTCKKWAHCECADVSKKIKQFHCELCA